MPIFNYRIKIGLGPYIKDCIIILWNWFLFLKNWGKSKKVLFYPEFPDWNTEIRKYVMSAGLGMTSNIQDSFDFIFYWEDTTIRSKDNTLLMFQDKYKILNCRNTDISKEHVEKIFFKIFSYSTFIDPYTYSGLAIKKLNINGRHILDTIYCPIKNKEQGFIYQKLIKPKIVKEGLASELRVYIFGNNIPFVLEELKSPSRIKLEALRYNLLDPLHVFTESEIGNILRFTREINLDYGELDIIRDTDDQKIYIIDVNNTPHLGNESKMPKVERKIKQQLFLAALTELLKLYEMPKEDAVRVG